MTSAARLLHRQLDEYDHSFRTGSGDAPAWLLEAWLEAGLSIFRLIRRLDEHWAESARSGAAGVTDADAREIHGLYEAWLRNVAGPVGRVGELEAAGCALADAAEIRDAQREACVHLSVPLAAALGGVGEGPDVPSIENPGPASYPA